MKTVKICVSCLALVLICSCATVKPPSTSYYMLVPAQNTTPLPVPPPAVRVELPGYLTQGPLVLQLDEQRIQPAYYHRWAEPLQSLVERYIAHTMQQSMTATTAATQTTVIFTSFNGSSAGDVRISGQWWTTAADTTPVVNNFDFHHQQEQAGYAGTVTALQQLLNKLCNDITQHMPQQ